jgi:hypothetical protein
VWRNIKKSQIPVFDAKLRFALLVSLCFATFSENKVDNFLVTLPAGVKLINLLAWKKTD